MRHNRAENTRNVPTSKRNTRLLQAIEALLGLAQKPIDPADRLFKRRKLDHRIRNLAGPKRVQTLVQARNTLFPNNLAPPLPQAVCKRWQGSLHADLDCFHGAQRDISQELCGGRGSEENDLFGDVGCESLAIEVFEDLVEAVFAGALHGVADEGGRPAEEDAAQAFFGVDHFPGLRVGLVEGGVDLATAFHLGEVLLAILEPSFELQMFALRFV
jgi:hypothetical protein